MKHAVHHVACGALLHVTLLGATASGEELNRANENLRLERLTALGKAWGRIRYVHPSFAVSTLDWDQSGTTAIRAVSAARSKEEYAAAVDRMATTLRDPMTLVVQEPQSKARLPPPPDVTDVVGGVLVIRAAAFCSLTFYARAAAATATIEKIKGVRAVVVDLRTAAYPGCDLMFFPLDDLAPWLIRKPMEVPAYQWLVRGTYSEPEDYSGTGLKMVQEMPAHVSPAGHSPVPRVVFLAENATVFPRVGVALSNSAGAHIVSHGDLVDAPFEELPLGEGYVLRVRTAFLTSQSHVRANIVETDSNEAFNTALLVARGRRPPRPQPPLAAPTGRDRLLPPALTSETYPSRERRILAAYRLWNAIELFYPYPELARGWTESLPHLIADLENTEDSRAFGLAVMRAAAQLGDAHVRVRGGDVDAFIGVAAAPVHVEMVEDILGASCGLALRGTVTVLLAQGRATTWAANPGEFAPARPIGILAARADTLILSELTISANFAPASVGAALLDLLLQVRQLPAQRPRGEELLRVKNGAPLLLSGACRWVAMWRHCSMIWPCFDSPAIFSPGTWARSWPSRLRTSRQLAGNTWRQIRS
jgi:hypothetical protein